MARKSLFLLNSLLLAISLLCFWAGESVFSSSGFSEDFVQAAQAEPVVMAASFRAADLIWSGSGGEERIEGLLPEEISGLAPAITLYAKTAGTDLLSKALTSSLFADFLEGAAGEAHTLFFSGIQSDQGLFLVQGDALSFNTGPVIITLAGIVGLKEQALAINAPKVTFYKNEAVGQISGAYSFWSWAHVVFPAVFVALALLQFALYRREAWRALASFSLVLLLAAFWTTLAGLLVPNVLPQSSEHFLSLLLEELGEIWKSEILLLSGGAALLGLLLSLGSVCMTPRYEGHRALLRPLLPALALLAVGLGVALFFVLPSL